MLWKVAGVAFDQPIFGMLGRDSYYCGNDNRWAGRKTPAGEPEKL